MFLVFSSVFVADKKIIFGYSFGDPSKFSLTETSCQKDEKYGFIIKLFMINNKL